MHDEAIVVHKLLFRPKVFCRFLMTFSECFRFRFDLNVVVSDKNKKGQRNSYGFPESNMDCQCGTEMGVDL